MILKLFLVTLLHLPLLFAYIPALPSNLTRQGTTGHSTSTLHLQWYTNGSDWEYVAHQLIGPEVSNVPVQGIFVHFAEDGAGNDPTTTPWIAFVSCDANSTNSSSETDIFTMAKDLGAKSAVLYSLYSQDCVVNPSYQSSVLDVFTTQTLDVSRRIEYEFGEFGPLNEAYYGYFNTTMLNASAQVINDTIASHNPTAPGFIFATLPAYNATTTGTQGDANGTGTSTSTGNSGSQNTGVAMIVLYTITGCVSALFSAVIVSGAIRAIRYPERYGPRAADPALGGGQSRAGGLGRAILDTFPIVKFRPSGTDREPGLSRPKDVESAAIDTESSVPVLLPDSVQLAQATAVEDHDELPHERQGRTAASTTGQEPPEGIQASEATDQGEPSQTHAADRGTPRVPAPPRETETRMPECMGRETCPICIVDFEEGDDLRVLPCEGKHRFHQSCVDPWLLELSGSCPICRQDFHALETIISGESGSGAAPANRHSEGGSSSTQNRFSRYLRFARRRQGRPVSRDYQMSPLPPES